MTGHRAVLILVAWLAAPAIAGPLVESGDMALRHDIQRLADYGVIKGPVTTWPIAWGPILEDMRAVKSTNLPASVRDSYFRLKRRAEWEARTQELTIRASVAAAENPTRMRSFQDTPRGNAEITAGASWIDDWFAIDLDAQLVDSDQDSEELRADGSMIGVMAGNWSISVNTLERWWGPAWDSTIILSNNARPIPSLTIERIFTDPFESRWLRWLGPWDLTVTFGQLEHDRHVPDAQFFGMRLNFRPVNSLEIGISRSAQWCGEGRPCDFDTFVDLFLGNDNIGDSGISGENEPGNQLAGFDFRWTPGFLDSRMSAYGQFTGEDEAGGLPSRWLGQFGAEWSGYLFDRWSTRVFGEFSATSCQFNETSERFNCAYNHGIYETGYRYRGRTIGHSADNDSRVISVGAMMVDVDDTQWQIVARYGALNRSGPFDDRNSLTPKRQDIVSIDISHSRVFPFGVVEVGAGFEDIDAELVAASASDGRFYLQWRSSY